MTFLEISTEQKRQALEDMIVETLNFQGRAEYFTLFTAVMGGSKHLHILVNDFGDIFQDALINVVKEERVIRLNMKTPNGKSWTYYLAQGSTITTRGE